MTTHTSRIRVVALLERQDGSIELFRSDGRPLGCFVRLDNRTARLARAARECLAADWQVLGAIARAGRGRAVFLTDQQLAHATGLSLPTVYRARVRLGKAGLLQWKATRRGNIYAI